MMVSSTHFSGVQLRRGVQRTERKGMKETDSPRGGGKTGRKDREASDPSREFTAALCPRAYPGPFFLIIVCPDAA